MHRNVSIVPPRPSATARPAGGRLRAGASRLWCCLLLLGALPAGAAEIPFGPPSSITVAAPDVHRILVVDLDGDGDRDVLSASTMSGDIWLYEHDGSPTPGWIPQSLDTGSIRVDALAAGDLDGDGDLDLLSASEADAHIVMYINDGGPLAGWLSTEISPGSNLPRWLEAADLDGDGDVDVLAAWDDTFGWYENGGGGVSTIWTEHVLGSGVTASSILPADVDRDGDLDAVVAAAGDDTVAWLENDGTPASWPVHAIDTSADGVNALFVADLNRDGSLDVLARTGTDGDIVWYEDDGTPPTGWVRRGIASSDPHLSGRVLAADMDADGDLDVLSGPGFGGLSWYENLGGAPPSWTPRLIPSAAPASDVAVADLDGDGDQDVLTGEIAFVRWFENRTIHRSALFPDRTPIATGDVPRSHPVSGDIDRDGDLDLAIMLRNRAPSSPWKVTWLENLDGAGSFGAGQVVFSDPSSLLGLDLADVDGDGDLDVLASFLGAQGVRWFENDGTPGGLGDWAEHVILLSGGGREVFGADLDADGDRDVLYASEGDDRLLWFENDGGAPPGWTERTISTLGDRPIPVLAADVDGDGDLDVLSAWFNDDQLAWHENDGGAVPGWTDHVISDDGSLRGPSKLAVGDLNRDGNLDVLVSATQGSVTDDRLFWFENDGGGPPAWTPHALDIGTVGPSFAVADLDGDGDLDVAGAWPQPPDNRFTWYENLTGDGLNWELHTFMTPALFPVGLLAGDVDGDGDPDLVSGTQDDDTVSWHENRGGQFALPTVSSAPPGIDEGVRDDVLRISAAHRGRTGDSDVGLRRIELLLADAAGVPLTGVQANALVSFLGIYADDGDGSFDEGSDTLVGSAGPLTLAAGVLDLDVAGPETLLPVAAQRDYFVVLEPAPGAVLAVPNRLQVRHRTETSSEAEDAASGIPLALEFTPEAVSGVVTAQLAGPPTVTAVAPPDDALGVDVGISVTVRFSEPMDVATMTPDVFRLLDPTGAAVVATTTLTPDRMTATLDPLSSLAFSTVYTLEVLKGVSDRTGFPVMDDFRSRFETAAGLPTGTPLPSVSDQTTLPGALAGSGGSTESALALTAGDNLGISVGRAGDLDGDGVMDFLGGAPGYPVGGIVEAGAVIVGLGSGVQAERVLPDLIFHGVGAHDRAGVAVAGGFDFNGDGFQDILVGAEQMDRTQEPAVAVGPGKVYLIFFQPLEYDFNANGTPDYAETPPLLVPLSEVGVSISGVELVGEALGDQAGAALAAGGHLNAGDVFEEILIGAPGRNGGAGGAYLLFGTDDDQLEGVDRSLGDVGVDGPSGIPGVLYTGGGGERLGSSVALPGDVTGSGGGDVVLGAPSADLPGAVDAGLVYVDAGGDLGSGSRSAAVLATTIQGEQPCEQLGFAVAGGGDSRADGQIDLLLGAPGYDTGGGDPCAGGSSPDAGRVLHLSARLPAGTIDAAQVGDLAHANPLPGVIWRGVQPGSLLGWSVGGLGDVTGNGLEDVSLGAPFASPGLEHAGALYVIEGSADPGFEGTVEATLVGQTISGTFLIGQQLSERAGVMVSQVGNLDADARGTNDFTVGAPGWNQESGTVHQVLDAAIPPPGRCGPLGCVVADLQTGARLAVPPASLPATAHLAVQGLVDPVAHVPSCDPAQLLGSTMIGATDFDDEGRQLAPGLPAEIELPTRAAVEYQLSLGEEIDLRLCDGSFGWIPLEGASTGTVEANRYVPGRLAVTTSVDELHVYAAFFPDSDGDDARNACDCDSTDPSIWAPPGPPRSLLLSHDAVATTLDWDPPVFPGGVSIPYDTLRSAEPWDFLTGITCVDSNGTDTQSSDTAQPPLGEGFYYLVRTRDPCPFDPGCFVVAGQRPAAACAQGVLGVAHIEEEFESILKNASSYPQENGF